MKTVADVEKGSARMLGVASSFDVEDVFSKAIARSYANGDKK